jgi:Family of unknown function (DUF6152)
VKARRVLLFAFAVTLAVSLVGSVALAHHGRAGYDQKDTPKTIKGTVTEYSWKNPHVSIAWEAKDAGGKPVVWTGEFSSPTTMLSYGMSRSSFKVGDEVNVSVIAAKGGIPYGLVTKITRPDGKVVIDLSERLGVVFQ